MAEAAKQEALLGEEITTTLWCRGERAGVRIAPTGTLAANGTNVKASTQDCPRWFIL